MDMASCSQQRTWGQSCEFKKLSPWEIALNGNKKQAQFFLGECKLRSADRPLRMPGDVTRHIVTDGLVMQLAPLARKTGG